MPIAIFTAIYLVEYGRGAARAAVVSFMVDILTGVPSIVAALFIYAVWITTFGASRVGFAVSLALVLLMIPVVVRSTEEMLKLVPNELREASYALGVPKWKTIVRSCCRRPSRHHHRHHARPRPGDGRDRAAADPGALHDVHQRQPLQRAHGRAAHADLHDRRATASTPPSTGCGPQRSP